MDRFWKIFGSFALVICCFACSKAHQLNMSWQDELLVVSHGQVTKFSAQSTEAAKLRQWFSEHRSGWEPYIATAAEGDLQIKTAIFTLNIRGEVAVLNYQYNAGQEQLRKTINPADFAFLRR